MKVLFVYHEDLSKQELGSIGTYILEIIRYVSKIPQYSCTYMGPTPSGSYPDCLSPQSYLAYPPKESGKRKWMPETIRIMKEFYSHRHYGDNTLISVHRWEQALPFLLNRKRGPVILTIHGSGEFTTAAYQNQPELIFFHWLMEKLALRFVDKILLVSRNAFNFYQKKYPRWSEKFIYIPTFASNKSFFPIPREKALEQLGVEVSDVPILLYAGRLVTEKNIPAMIDLLDQYCQKGSPAKLWIVGEGPEKKNLEKIVKEKKISQHVIFWGQISHDRLVYIYNTADVLLLFSSFEGTPLTLLESLSCGTPCLATSVGDLPAIIQNGVNGYIVELNNMDSLVNNLVNIIQNRKVFRTTSMNSSKPYQTVEVIPRIIDCYIKTNNKYFAK